MADTSPKTFPGVYTQITDQSFLPPQLSRFRPAFIGVTSKGPFDIPTRVRSLKEFIQVFGRPVTFTTDPDTGQPIDSTGYYVADAVQLAADYTNDLTIVRVGNHYSPQPILGKVSGVGGHHEYMVAGVAGNAVAQAVQDLMLANDGQLYLRLSEPYKATSVSMQVDSVNVSTGTITFEPKPLGHPLSAQYTTADIHFSAQPGAANQAEAVVYAYQYMPKLDSLGAVTGLKNGSSFTLATTATGVEVGRIYKIVVDNNWYAANTYEIRVKQVVGNTVYIETTNQPRVGYQALALQDNYGGDSGNLAYLYKATTDKVPLFRVLAKTAGEWANGANSTQGLYLRVRPGSKPGTKKLEVLENGALMETHDNLSEKPLLSDSITVNPDYYKERLLASQLVEFSAAEVGAAGDDHIANTANPWDPAFYGPAAVSGAIEGMPAGAINAGNLIYRNTSYYTGGQFSQGANGQGATEQDFAGIYDSINDVYTGIQSLRDPDNVTCNMLFVPINLDGFSGPEAQAGVVVMDALFRTAKAINAIAITDVPPGLSATEATDWHNGTGFYTGRPRIDSANIAIYWNWFTMIDRFTNLPKLVPPSIGAVRCFGITFQRDKPWYAAAGETRGFIPEVQIVQYDRVGIDTRHAMYGAGNSVNPILKIRGQHYIYGERTMQRAESKLTAIHNVILVNYVVDGLAQIGRRFVFDPNDLELLVHIRLAFSEYLDKIRNERGIEEYELVVDQRNNTPETRNRREVIVDLSVVPTDVAERIFINATVRESGANLNTAG